MGSCGRAGGAPARPPAGPARDVLPGQIGGRGGGRAWRPGGNRQVPCVLRAPGAQAGLGRTGASTMTGMAGCREIRQALGVYVLGAIDPAERARVDEHLATCADCREELAGLAGLPAMLRRVPMAEAQRLAVADQADSATEETSPDELLPSLLTRTAQARRVRRWRELAAAAAVVVLALGAGAAGASLLGSGSSPAA